MACGSKPCTPGEHPNRWQMDVHPPQNGAIGSAPWPYILEHLDGSRALFVGLAGKTLPLKGHHSP